MHFVVNKMSYCFISGPGPLLIFLHASILITPIKWPNVSRMCEVKTSSKLCSFSATDCPISSVD